MEKKILILKACGHSDETLEIENIISQSKLYGISPTVECINDKKDLRKALKKQGDYDYIYLSSHGNNKGFCNTTRTLNMEWQDFGSLICESNCLRESCILMLSCCRGGLNEVAYDMFWMCDQIEYVVGPRQSLISSDILIGFNLLLYNLEYRNLDPIVACNRVLKGTDIRFRCFDRMETMSDPAYIERAKFLDNALDNSES